MLSITFDDGPDERWTAAIVATLARHDVTATFFVIGERVRGLPEVLDSVLAAGHDVQLHCDRHVRHTELSEQEIELDVRAALASLALHGVRPSWWRTPWGVRTAASRAVADRHGLKLVNWSLDSEDWRGEPAASSFARIAGFADGDSILMHDAIGPGATRSGCENTVELVSELISRASRGGLEVGPLGEARLPALACGGERT